jgi:hypothetical protein
MEIGDGEVEVLFISSVVRLRPSLANFKERNLEPFLSSPSHQPFRPS